MYNGIIRRLREIEIENDITIIYACESGSRAWGFDNSESDWDVRFIYRRNDPHRYLTLDDSSEILEYMGDRLDFVGWDIRKALKLHYTSNPNLREWILSPIVYIDFKENIFEGLPDFDRATLKFHYTNIAKSNWKRLSQEDLQITKRAIKMFLYNCRCVMAWMVLDEGQNPSINIFDLMNQVSLDGNVAEDIKTMIADYRNDRWDETDPQVIDAVRQWMRPNLEIMRRDFPKKDKSKNMETYNRRFFDMVLPKYDEYCRWRDEDFQ